MLLKYITNEAMLNRVTDVKSFSLVGQGNVKRKKRKEREIKDIFHGTERGNEGQVITRVRAKFFVSKIYSINFKNLCCLL